ncbi:DUF6879 family protein [Paractinoplanes brasiliensis]|uniref:DUF6879 domain-containing protein n=1 Tax=Paractinoplanes brasiliensis TaxID=52695 RepID=A0A4R6K0F5_9ACTN|nr:hypothetical protein [Actinoplanes brasiliensis]TDO42539.1 hypothetical protein C8E87_6312 [Actinoplanes brasiliensis]GID31357.1 hypothetical protein Abr02nite_63400 [Actinoplanes brasiliensis]
MTGETPARTLAEGQSVVKTAGLTLATGAITYLVTNGLNQPPATSIMLSILIGGITLMVRFLVDFERRLASVEKLERDGMADMKKLVGDAFSKINEATELFGSVEASALQTDVVTQLVRHSTQISPSSPPIVYKFVQTRIKDMSDFLKQLSEGGTATYYGEDRDWLLGLTRAATTSVDAISLDAVDHGLWQSEIGQRYLDAQRLAARAGRRVRRIFVLESSDMEHDPDLQRACRDQQEMGIEVRLLDRTSVPSPLKIQVRDLVLFDDILAYETLPTISEPSVSHVAETRLVLTESRVKECSQLYRELWEVSRAPRPDDSPSGP